MVTTALHLDYFGIRVRVSATAADLAEVAFHAGPHLRTTPEPAPPHFDVRLATADGCVREAIVRRGELTVLRRPFRSWSNVPAPVPPFAALEDRLCLVPAIVLARGSSVLAVIGSALSPKGGIGVALARRGWAFVSGQLLVLDRRTGYVLPYLAPVELRGGVARELATSGLAAGTSRRVPSKVSPDVLLVRPESLGRVVARTARLARPRLVRLCRSADERIHLVQRPFQPQPWPASAASTLSDVPSYLLELPAAEVADEAAELLCTMLRTDEEQPCLDALHTVPDRPVGLTA